MGGGLVARGEDARAFHRDVDVEIFPRQRGWILDGQNLELLLADADRVSIDADLMREAAMHAVEAQQMGVGLDRAEIVDGHDVDVLAAGLEDGAHDVAADAAKAIDGNSNSHEFPPSKIWRLAGDIPAKTIEASMRPMCAAPSRLPRPRLPP